MSQIIETGDLSFIELVRFLPQELWKGKWYLPIVVSVPRDRLKQLGINLEKEGCDADGKGEGGIYYKMYTYPDLISNSIYLGQDEVRIVLTGLKNMATTPLTDLYFKFIIQNQRLREQINALMADNSKWKIEFRKATSSSLSWVQEIFKIKQGLKGGEDFLEQQEAMKKEGGESGSQ